jgi:hypothetical protein
VISIYEAMEKQLGLKLEKDETVGQGAGDRAYRGEAK